MKSKSMSAKWARAMLAGLLLGAGLAQATPVCAPTYSINSVTAVVTLVANCTPDVNSSINFTGGYAWLKDAVPLAGANTGVITQTVAESEGFTYSVHAKNKGSNFTINDFKAVTVVVSAPTPCELQVPIVDAAPISSITPGASVTINQGAPATLVPVCVGADTVEWYSKVGNSPYTHILPPPGGVVFPLAATTKYYVVGSNDYGDTASDVMTVNTVAPLAGCTISPASASKTVGATGLFTATCSGGTPTTYAWTLDGGPVGGNSSNYTTLSSLTAATHAVGLTVGNAGGSSSSASATLVVSALPKSACTSISPAAPSVTVGNASPLLTATCDNSPTSTGYHWNLDGAALSCTGSTCTVPAGSLPATTTYNVTVTADNAGGGAGTQAASATITVSLQPKSACTSISPAAPSVTVGNASPLLTATCDNSPTSTGYHWKLDGAALSCTGSTCTVPAASLTSTTTPYAVTVTADNVGGGVGTQQASAVITVNPVPVGGGNNRCAANGVTLKTDITAMNWGSGVLKPLNLKANEAYALSFSAPLSMSAIRQIMTQYSAANKRITVSLDACGFDTPLNNSTACSVQQGGRTPETGPLYSPTSSTGACYVPPGTTYYVNIRNSIPGSNPVQSSCTNANGCGFMLIY